MGISTIMFTSAPIHPRQLGARFSLHLRLAFASLKFKLKATLDP